MFHIYLKGLTNSTWRQELDKVKLTLPRHERYTPVKKVFSRKILDRLYKLGYNYHVK